MPITHQYRFDNNYNDSVGSDNITNTSASIFASGKINQAYQSNYDSINGYVNAVTSVNLLPTSGAFSIAFWIYVRSNNGSNIFFVYNATTLNTALSFNLASATSAIQVADQVSNTISVNNAYAVGSWYHFVTIYDGSAWSFYVNGSSATGTVTLGTTPSPSAGQSAACVFKFSGDNFADGYYLDDLRIYNEAISAATVSFIYNSGSGTQTTIPSVLVTADRVLETTTTTGTGSLALAGAVTGYNSFSNGVGASNMCYYSLDSSGSSEWEVGLGTLDSVGTTLARTSVIRSSNSNSVVNLSAGTKRVYVTYPGAFVIPTTGYIGANNNSPPSYVPGGRLTNVSNSPISGTSGTGSTIVYYTPYTSDLVYLTTSTGYWRPYTLSQISTAMTALPSDTVYDIFLYDDAGTLTLERSTAFTSRTTRVDAISLRNGVYVKSSDPTRLWLGTISTRAAGQSEDTAARRFIWNAYNRVMKSVYWNYTSAGSFSMTTAIGPITSGATPSRVEIICGSSTAETLNLFLSAAMTGSTAGGAGVTATLGFGVNTTTAYTAQRTVFQQVVNSSNQYQCATAYSLTPALGYSFISFNQNTNTASVQSIIGNTGSGGQGGSIMRGVYWC